MPVTQKNFSDHILWNTPGNYHYAYRAYAVITIHGRNRPAVHEWGLIDTGADYLVIPYSIANSTRIDRNLSQYKNIRLANGNTIQLPFLDVSFTIKGVTRTAKAVVGTQNHPLNRTPLIGLKAMLSAFDFAFDKRGWLYSQ